MRRRSLWLRGGHLQKARILSPRAVDQARQEVQPERAGLWEAGAFALPGDKTKAKTACEDFFTLWKDAYPDVPLLKRARAEHVSLN